LVVEVAVDDAAGAAVVVRGDALGQAVEGVVPGLVAVVVGERKRVDAVAGVVGAYDLAGQDGGGCRRRCRFTNLPTKKELDEFLYQTGHSILINRTRFASTENFIQQSESRTL